VGNNQEISKVDQNEKSRDSSVGIAPGYWLDDRVRFPTRAKIFDYFTSSWAQSASNLMGTWALSLGLKRLATHFQLVPRSSKLELYLHSLICLHGIVLNLLSTGINLPHILSNLFIYFNQH
jgi:hypothetical protein